MHESYQITFRGRRLLLVLDDATARDVIRVAGCTPPEIPAGCNTVSMLFRAADGRAALAINQRGFARIARDDEAEINGCGVAILQDDLPNEEAAAMLEAWYAWILKE